MGGGVAVRVLQRGAPEAMCLRSTATTTSTRFKDNEHPNPHHGQNAAVLLSRTYVFAAFDGRWPGVAFLILALSGQLDTWPYYPRCMFLISAASGQAMLRMVRRVSPISMVKLLTFSGQTRGNCTCE